MEHYAGSIKSEFEPQFSDLEGNPLYIGKQRKKLQSREYNQLPYLQTMEENQ